MVGPRPSGNSGAHVPVFPILLIALGALLLLQTLGVAPWDLWRILWRFWPVILVIVGLNLLIGRTLPGLVWLVAVVGLLAAVGVSWAIASLSPDKELVSERSEPLGSLQRARVNISFGAGELRIGPLPDGSENLVEGSFRGDASWSMERSGNEGQLNLGRSDGNFFGGVKADWKVLLTREIPLELKVNAGASDINLDLEQLQVTNLELNIGASDVDLVLSTGAGDSQVSIEGGAASVTVTFPPGLAGKIITRSGLSSIRIDQGRFPKVGNDYVSSDFNTAANKATVTIRTGVSSVRVK